MNFAVRTSGGFVYLWSGCDQDGGLFVGPVGSGFAELAGSWPTLPTFAHEIFVGQTRLVKLSFYLPSCAFGG
jgi:hypothetical protein